MDVTARRQMTGEALKGKAKLYRPNVVVYWKREAERNAPIGAGSRKFVGQNPPSGAQIYYSLTKKAEKVIAKVVDYAGSAMTTLKEGKTEPGLHRIECGLRRAGGAR